MAAGDPGPGHRRLHRRPGDRDPRRARRHRRRRRPAVTLESDKATMDVPAPVAGTVGELRVAVGDQVSEGSVIMTIERRGRAGHAAEGARARRRAPEPAGSGRLGSPSGVYDQIEVTVPDIGDFADVPVIEVHVAAGDTVAAEDPLITLESDKATMDVPAPAAGTVDRGQGRGHGSRARVSTGTADRATCRPGSRAAGAGRQPRRPPARAAVHRRAGDLHAEVLVLGAGPGWLHRGVPGRRPGQAGRPGGQPRPAGRGLPQRGLHPVQGAAARGEGDRRDQGDGRRTALSLRRARRSTSTRCAAGRTAWSPGSPAGWPGWPSSARSPRWSAPAGSPR